MTLENETELKELTEVLDTLSDYVPMHVATKTVSVEGKDYTIDDSRIIQSYFLVTSSLLLVLGVQYHYEMMTNQLCIV